MYSSFFKSFGLLLLLSIAYLHGYAQQTSDSAPSDRAPGNRASGDRAPVETAPVDTARIVLLARAYGDSIVLRWGPTTSLAWQQLNQVGYQVERHTILRNGKLLETPERQILSNNPIRPRPLSDWQMVVDRDKYAAIAAQALYGTTFDVRSSGGSDLVQMINQATAWEQRFSFTLFSSDVSATAARYAGLRFTDRDIRANEKYLYKVFAAQPVATVLDTGLVFLAGSERTELPVPTEVTATFDDRRVMLKWNTYYHQAVYMAYRVERSTDGISFAPISELPIATVNRSHPSDHYQYKSDSFPNNGTTYHYRVRGLTPFGEVGPPSEAVSGQGYRELQSPPTITEASVTPSGTALLRWGIDEAATPLVRGFSVEKASAVAGPYQAIASSLPDTTRRFEDAAVEGTSYYQVVGHGQRDEKVRSFPVLVQAEDSIPPTVPTSVTGRIDTTGQVHLHWPASLESDVLGYRIFRSNHPDRDFIQITGEPTADTSFVDGISLKNLTRTIYYKVSAVDQRFNPSPLSEAVALQKPDIIPPVSPTFRTARPQPGGIRLSWLGSPSEDVAHYLIYRRMPDETSWKLTGTVTDTARHFRDETVTPSQAYEYVLLAVDQNQLESLPTSPLRVVSWAATREKIEHTYAELDEDDNTVHIRWDYRNDNVREYHIYRVEAEGALRWHHSVAAPQLQFHDESVTRPQTYRYRIRAVYSDGSQSPLSDALRVQL